MLIDRLRVPTPYPLPPRRLISELSGTRTTGGDVRPGVGRLSRDGPQRAGPHVSAPRAVERSDSKVDPESLKAWTQLRSRLRAHEGSFGKPTRVVNDADLQGLDAATGKGLEVVVTLGTGFGTAVLYNGQLLPHMEFSQHPLRKATTTTSRSVTSRSKKVGKKAWNKRVRKAIAALDAVFEFDHLYIGGGNAKNLKGALGERVSVIDTNAGLLGGIRLWDHAHVPAPRRQAKHQPRHATDTLPREPDVPIGHVEHP